MTIKEIALVAGLSVLVHFAIEALECAIWTVIDRMHERRIAKRKRAKE